MAYIRFPIDTDPLDITQEIYAYIQALAPEWSPNENNLDVWLIKALSAKTAENRDLASDVQDDIFRYYGSTLMGVPPLDATPATAHTTWTMIDTLGHTIPAGTAISIRDSDGNSFVFNTVVAITVPAGSSTTVAGDVVVRALLEGTDSNGLGGAGQSFTTGIVELIDVLDFVTNVTMTDATAGGTDGESDEDYLNRLVRRLHRLSQRPIIPQDFADAALDVSAEIERAIAIDLYNPLHNLLTAENASGEGSTTGNWVGSNGTITNIASVMGDGARSFRIDRISSAPFYAIIPVANATPCVPGETLTAVARAAPSNPTSNLRVGIQWVDAGGAAISQSYGSTVVTSVAVDLSVTATAPAGTVKAQVFVQAVTGTELVYFLYDKVGLRRGTGTDWVIGGTGETNQPLYVTVFPVGADGLPVSAGAKTALQTYYDTNRQINYKVYVRDPFYANIDVTTTVIVAPGWDTTTVHDAVVAQIQAYLNPANWGKDPAAAGSDADRSWVLTSKVYYNEMITAISNVPGVARVSALTMGNHGGALAAADITLPSPVGLTTSGTVTVTAA